MGIACSSSRLVWRESIHDLILSYPTLWRLPFHAPCNPCNTTAMAPKEPTRAQLSSKLSYQQSVPSFLTKFKNRMAGVVDEDDEDEDEEFEHVGDGREPIPRRPRPAIPERPADDPGSADEDGYDERPQVVVLREGKHLTAREAENVRRKGACVCV